MNNPWTQRATRIDEAIESVNDIGWFCSQIGHERAETLAAVTIPKLRALQRELWSCAEYHDHRMLTEYNIDRSVETVINQL